MKMAVLTDTTSDDAPRKAEPDLDHPIGKIVGGNITDKAEASDGGAALSAFTERYGPF